jgi:hypothetical protein
MVRNLKNRHPGAGQDPGSLDGTPVIHVRAQKVVFVFPEQESACGLQRWIPAYAGMTIQRAVAQKPSSQRKLRSSGFR